MEYEGKYKAVIGYKEESGGNAAFKVNRCYFAEWMDEDALPLKLEGLSVDSVRLQNCKRKSKAKSN